MQGVVPVSLIGLQTPRAAVVPADGQDVLQGLQPDCLELQVRDAAIAACCRCLGQFPKRLQASRSQDQLHSGCNA